MKKIIGVILVLCTLWACNYDDACPTPNTEQSGGVGGGPVLPPGGGGFGEAPSPEPQNETSAWVCTGQVTGCTFGGGPNGWSLGCDTATGVGDELADAMASLVYQCQKLLRETHGYYWTCTDIEDLNCFESVPEDWECTGRTSCKAGDGCVHEDDSWPYECAYDRTKARGRTAEIARSDLLQECEDRFRTLYGEDMFCMPGTLKCTAP